LSQYLTSVLFYLVLQALLLRNAWIFLFILGDSFILCSPLHVTIYKFWKIIWQVTKYNFLFLVLKSFMEVFYLRMGRNIVWECLRTGSWGGYLDQRGMKWWEGRENCITRSFMICTLHQV
jgi:hypothetical protein